MNPRTVRDFTASTSVWPVVEAWAKESSYSLKESSQSTRLYQRGMGFWTAPMMLEITQSGDNVHVEAWVKVNVLARLMALFMLPAEMTIESGGARGILPRNLARGAVNKLLGQLGQPPIP